MNYGGFSQQVAASVLYYREKHGDFYNIDQLLKVKGVRKRMLRNLRYRLTVCDTECTTSSTSNQQSHYRNNGENSKHNTILAYS